MTRLAALLLVAATACTSSSAGHDNGTPTCGASQMPPATCDPDALDASMDCTGCDGGTGFTCVCSPGALGETDDGGGPGWVCVSSGHACQ